jgi:hypothetical protein
VRLTWCALVVAAACGGKNAASDARSVPRAGSDAAAAAIGSSAGSGSGASAIASGGRGAAQVRVEWKAPPAAVTASPGRDACGSAMRPDVEPTSTWGIPEVAVWIDVAPVTRAEPAVARLVVSPCAITPRVAVAHPGDKLAIASAIEAPITATVMHYGDPSSPLALAGNLIATAIPAGALIRVQLPVIGHEVDLALAAPAVDELRGSNSTDAWTITLATAAGVTDASGEVVLRDLPVGTHTVTAWLPRHGTAEARVAHGQVDVLPGGLAEVTLELGAPP